MTFDDTFHSHEREERRRREARKREREREERKREREKGLFVGFKENLKKTANTKFPKKVKMYRKEILKI